MVVFTAFLLLANEAWARATCEQSSAIEVANPFETGISTELKKSRVAVIVSANILIAEGAQ